MGERAVAPASIGGGATPRTGRGIRRARGGRDRVGPRGRARGPAGAPALDFAGGADAVRAVAEALHLAYGHQCNPAFASETARIDPLPHQRIAVYERMLRQDPLRFLLADDAGAGKTIMTGLAVREMLSRGRIERVIVVPPAGCSGSGSGSSPAAQRVPATLLPALDGYPPAARDRLRVRRPGTGAPCIWLHPGEPVFDALRQQVLRTCGRDALRGGIFTDPRAEAPYLVHLAEISVAETPEGTVGGSPDGRPRHGGTTDEPAPRERRLPALRQGEREPPVECSVEALLLLRPAPGVAPGTVPLAGRALSLRAEANAHAGHLLERIVEEQRTARRAELPERRRRVAANFECRAAELAARRTALGAGQGRDDARDELESVKRAQRAIRTERQRALAEVDHAPDRIAAGGIRFLAHALVVPADRDDDARVEEPAEEIAVRIATGWERDRGAGVQDVSRPALARAAGLPDWPGFDLLAHPPDGEPRCIEVKGRAGRTAVRMELNEWKQAFRRGDRYWLYVVFDCATPAPTLVRVQNPFDKLFAKHRASSTFTITAAALLKVMERTEPDTPTDTER